MWLLSLCRVVKPGNHYSVQPLANPKRAWNS